MNIFTSFTRRATLRLTMLAAATALAACEPIAFGGPAGGGPTIDASAAVPVALLLPSGSAGDDSIARDMENAARMAIADLDGVGIDLRVYRTGGDPAQAAGVGGTAVADGAKIVLGPLYSSAANSVGRAVAGAGVNVLAFSNNPAIAGGNVFILGNSFDNTAARLADFAARQGKRNILVVHANSEAEIIGRDAISRALSRSGARMAGSVGFELSQQGIVDAVPRIVAQAKSSGADALFLTSNTDTALPLLAQLLPEAGLPGSVAQYIGLTRWDVPTNALTLPGLQGGWFALPDPSLSARFNSRFAAAYGNPPHPLAGLAYDGVAAVGALVKSRGASALTAQALTQGSGFVGVNGVFRFRGDGTIERGLAVAQIQNQQVTIIDPAPRSFGGAGF